MWRQRIAPCRPFANMTVLLFTGVFCCRKAADNLSLSQECPACIQLSDTALQNGDVKRNDRDAAGIGADCSTDAPSRETACAPGAARQERGNPTIHRAGWTCRSSASLLEHQDGGPAVSASLVKQVLLHSSEGNVLLLHIARSSNLPQPEANSPSVCILHS